jgi:hypothetical protein
MMATGNMKKISASKKIGNPWKDVWENVGKRLQEETRHGQSRMSKTVFSRRIYGAVRILGFAHTCVNEAGGPVPPNSDIPQRSIS